MSSRAIRRLRQEKYFGGVNNDDNDDYDDGDDGFDDLGLMLPQTKKKKKKKKKNMKKVIEYVDESDSDNLSDHLLDDDNCKDKDGGVVIEGAQKNNNDSVGSDDDLSLSSDASEASSLYEPTQKKASTFSSLLMMDDSDSDEDKDEDSEDVSDSGGGGELNEKDEDEGSEENRYEQAKISSINYEKEGRPKENISLEKMYIDDNECFDNKKDIDEDDDDDFDAILSEFHASDRKQQELSEESHSNDIGSSNKSTKMNIFLNDIDPRDFDLEHSLRSMLGGSGGVANINVNNVVRVAQGGGNNNMGGGGNRRNVTLQKRCLFAQGREDWGRRPSSYIGGGLGMEEIEFQVPSESITSKEEEENDKESIHLKRGEEETDKVYRDEETDRKNYAPWPYSDPTLLPTSQQYTYSSSSWHKFQRSSTYTAKLEEFRSYVSTTGDINMLAMFVADNPFIAEPILQLAMFFFHTRENEKGLDLIKRILWILECACTSGFLPSPTSSRQNNNNVHNGKKTKFMFMDQSSDENELFFSTLNLFVKNSTMVGCVNTSLAGCRLLLSLDPLRDPKGVLLIMDYFCLATMKEADYLFVINLIESEMISIYHRGMNDIGEYESHSCELIQMPNWQYSYALALYKLSFLMPDEDEEDELKVKATEALKSAIRSYPFIPKLLLEKNKINTTGRSFLIDWPSVLSPLGEFTDDLVNHEAAIAGLLANHFELSKQKITKIFIDRCHKLWCGDDVVKWLYDCCVEVVSVDTQTNCEATTHVPLALLRYSSYDPADFEDSFAHIPAANALDPGLVDLALHVRQNARRLLRMPQQQGGMPNEFNIEGQQAIQQIRTLLGTGRDGMEVIDPDLPFAEIFWRSLMPWARVDGVPPGNNQNN